MRIANKKAKFNYKLLEKYEAGIALTGNEVKAIRNGQADLSQSHAKIIDNEMYLINANISGNRTRKLLLHKNQIVSIQSKIKARKLTLVPLALYNKGTFIKVELALAKAKRKFEKKEALKRKEIEREIEKELKK